MITSTYNQDEYNKENDAHRQQFRIKVRKIMNSCPRQKTTQSDYTSRISTSRRTCIENSPQNWNFHQKRRQSQLNTLFRIRKQKLQSITKINKEFYRRLNSQQSHYAIQDHSKEKDLNQKPILTFRTVDLKQSRQILGPIGNFNPSLSFCSKQKLVKSNLLNQLQNSHLKNIEINRISIQNTPRIGFQTPLKRKLLCQKQDPQKESIFSISKISKTITPLKNQLRNIDHSKFLKTPDRQNRLPQIFMQF